jgi:hypothetical protein
MSSDEYVDQPGPVPRRPPPPALYPRVTVPAGLAGTAGAVCVGADALMLVQATLTATLTSYSSPFYSRVPSPSFVGRLALFTTGGADLTVALVLTVGVVILAMAAPHQKAEVLGGHERALAVGALVIAAIVVLANAATCIEVLANIQSALRALGNPNRASGALELLAPMTLAVGSALYVASRLRRHLTVGEEGTVEVAGDLDQGPNA